MLGWAYSSTAYPPIWGPQTSIDNFCEEDYIVTGWAGEFVNTLTNMIYIYYALHGIKNSSSGSDGPSQRAAYAALGLVGVFSGAFHGMLKIIPNHLDSLSMLIAAGAVMYRVYTLGKSSSYRYGFAAGLIGSQLLVAFVLVSTGNSLLHNFSFGVICVSIARRVRWLMKERVTDDSLRKRLRQAARFGSIMGVCGYVLWLIDFAACVQLNNTRRAVGMPWGFLIELHGWWHIFTGIAAYTYIALVDIVLSQNALALRSGVVAEDYAWPLSWLLR